MVATPHSARGRGARQCRCAGHRTSAGRPWRGPDPGRDAPPGRGGGRAERDAVPALRARVRPGASAAVQVR